MVTVTARAMKKLEEKLRDMTASPRIAFRMTALSLSPVRVFLMLDDEREDDSGCSFYLFDILIWKVYVEKGG